MFQEFICTVSFNRKTSMTFLHAVSSDLFLEARQKSLKNFVGFLVQTMTSKSPFETNWPLICKRRHLLFQPQFFKNPVCCQLSPFSTKLEFRSKKQMTLLTIMCSVTTSLRISWTRFLHIWRMVLLVYKTKAALTLTSRCICIQSHRNVRVSVCMPHTIWY